VILGGYGTAYNSCGSSSDFIGLVRADSNGVADTSFGNGGVMTFNPYPSTTCYYGITANNFALESDGKIVTVGSEETTHSLELVRFEN
jgi:hypothetical protein